MENKRPPSSNQGNQRPQQSGGPNQKHSHSSSRPQRSQSRPKDRDQQQGNSNQPSQSHGGGNRQDDRNPRNQKYRKGPSQHQQQQRHHQQQNQHHQRRRPGNDELQKKYFDLLEQHNSARKKYFEQYYKVSLQTRNKLEREFHQTGDNLRKFENGLSHYQKAILFKGTLAYKTDLTYSQNHDLKPTGDSVNEGPHQDPHITRSQLSRPSYADDVEVSEGTLEDYYLIKGREKPQTPIKNSGTT